MTDFGRVLRGLESGLRLPAGRRTRVLLEVGQDLEDLRAAYRARGLDEAEARARAEAVLGPTLASAAELTALHAPWWAAMLDRLGEGASRRVERWLLAGSAGLAVLVGLSALRADALWASSPAASVAIVSVFVAGVVWSLLLWLRAAKRTGVAVTTDATLPIAGLVVLLGAMGLIGAAFELRELAEAVERTGLWPAAMLVAALGRTAHVLTLGLSTMLVVLLLWAPLYRLTRRTDAERAQLTKWSEGTGA